MAGSKFGNLELKVGLFVFISIALMAVILVTFSIKKRIFTPKIRVNIMTESGESIAKSMAVKYAGFTISKVYEVELKDDGNVVLETRIPKQYTKWIKQDSVAKLGSQNVIGSNYIYFTGGSADSAEIEDGMTFNLVREGGLAEVLEEAKPVIEDIKEIVSNIAEITATVKNQNDNTSKFFAGLGSVGDDLQNKTGSVGYLVRSDYIKNEVQSVLAKVEKLQNELLAIAEHTRSVVGNVDAKVDRTDETIDILNKALEAFREGVKAIQAAVESAQPSIDNTNQITGDVAEATDNITELKAQADSILKTTDRIMLNLEQRWPFSKDGEVSGEKVKLP
jgi:phospholipid/cholesterol/gamma-HCH transport system substrate-binding protein